MIEDLVKKDRTISAVSSKEAGVDDISLGVINISNSAKTDLGRYFSPRKKFNFILRYKGDIIRFKSMSNFVAWVRWGDKEDNLSTTPLNRSDFISLENKHGAGKQIVLDNYIAVFSHIYQLKIRRASVNLIRDLSAVSKVDFFYTDYKNSQTIRNNGHFIYTTALVNAIREHRSGNLYLKVMKPLDIDNIFKE